RPSVPASSDGPRTGSYARTLLRSRAASRSLQSSSWRPADARLADDDPHPVARRRRAARRGCAAARLLARLARVADLADGGGLLDHERGEVRLREPVTAARAKPVVVPRPRRELPPRLVRGFHLARRRDVR